MVYSFEPKKRTWDFNNGEAIIFVMIVEKIRDGRGYVAVSMHMKMSLAWGT